METYRGLGVVAGRPCCRVGEREVPFDGTESDVLEVGTQRALRRDDDVVVRRIAA